MGHLPSQALPGDPAFLGLRGQQCELHLALKSENSEVCEETTLNTTLQLWEALVQRYTAVSMEFFYEMKH